jgi:catechol 2,3-dioxygenase-like lactoylglutathione lyase family enzyme
MVEPSIPDVVSIRPFVPAKDFDKSIDFYSALGFTATRYGSEIAGLQLGLFGFLLQKYDVPAYAEQFMMQMVVDDLDRWWEKIAILELAQKFGVQAPSAPAMQPWGVRTAYVFDPTGVLWHFAENSR